jgi:hypothetical protein
MLSRVEKQRRTPELTMLCGQGANRNTAVLEVKQPRTTLSPRIHPRTDKILAVYSLLPSLVSDGRGSREKEGREEES